MNNLKTFNNSYANKVCKLPKVIIETFINDTKKNLNKSEINELNNDLTHLYLMKTKKGRLDLINNISNEDILECYKLINNIKKD